MATAARNTYAGAFVLGKTFQPSLTFVSGVTVLLTNVRQGWKVSPRKKTSPMTKCNKSCDGN